MDQALLMDRNPDNIVVVVTGGAGGLGFETANHFLRGNARVVIIVDVDEDQGIKVAERLNTEHGTGRAVFHKCDVTKDLEEVSTKIFKAYNQVDVLINCAGLLDEYNIRKVLEINTIALVEWSMRFFEHMRTDKGGKGGTIINIGSMYSLKVDPCLIFYKTSKHAVLMFSQSLGHQTNFRKFGVRVFAVLPGLTHTGMTSNKMPWDEHEVEFEEVCKKYSWQEASDVGRWTVEAFKSAESGSLWMIVGNVLGEYKFRKSSL